MKRIVIIGAGGHARSVADTIERAGKYQIEGFVDIDPCAKVGNYRHIGTDVDLPAIRNAGVENAAICLGFLGEGDKRQFLFQAAKQAGFCLPPIVDPSSVVANDAVIGEGAFVGKMAVVNASAVIGVMCIINSGAIVEHDCRVGDFSHVAVNATLCGGSSIGSASLVGASATVLQGIEVGSNVIVGAGSLLLSDVPDGSKIVGVYHV